MILRCLFLAGIFVALAPVGVAVADPEDCENAIEQYKSVRSDLHDSLNRYISCLADDDGHDDCSSEFGNVRSNQDDFESSVSDYESECD
jgi:hypothetical protein